MLSLIGGALCGGVAVWCGVDGDAIPAAINTFACILNLGLFFKSED